MFNVCPGCGEYSIEKEIDPSGPYAVCPYCGYKHPFVQSPLFVVTGASGTGKSTVCLGMPERLPECVCLETDILWRPELASVEDGYAGYTEVWLRVAKNVAQAGRPVVLFGSATPERFAGRAEARYFSAIHVLALVCADDVLEDRLRSRPAWRGAGTPEFLASMRAFNRWFVEHAGATEPPMELLDTTHLTEGETQRRVARWVRGRLAEQEAR